MSTQNHPSDVARSRSLHGLGVACGLAAGAWLGTAEAPTKLVVAGYSPYLISLGMVAGVFVARWTLPMALVGTRQILRDLREGPHLILWAVLAGMLWVVANTLTIFAIRDVGLSIAFPLWNTNSLVGLFWGWLLFKELHHAAASQKAKVLGGALAIVMGACLLAYATTQHSTITQRQALHGILAALGAGLLWGTMYIPYRKAYLSGMNPLSFVTVFTLGELVTMVALAVSFEGGATSLWAGIHQTRPVLFWLFLGGFCWVLGDLFQQYAAKYIGIGRGIPLSNTNQLWGLAWGALVFGEFAGQGTEARVLVAAGSLLMIVGAIAISLAEAAQGEQEARQKAVERECERYGLDPVRLEASLRGENRATPSGERRSWWEYLILVAAISIFGFLGFHAVRQPIAFHLPWAVAILAGSVFLLVFSARLLWKRTRFS
jgi:drug/metabolite transporter (DMT)-like permease